MKTESYTQEELSQMKHGKLISLLMSKAPLSDASIATILDVAAEDMDADWQLVYLATLNYTDQAMKVRPQLIHKFVAEYVDTLYAGDDDPIKTVAAEILGGN